MPFERDFRRLDRRLGRLDHRARRVELAPGRDHVGAHIALQVGLQARLRERFFRLASASVNFAALIDRHAELAGHRAIQESCVADADIIRVVPNAADDVEGRVKFALDKLDLQLGGVDGVKGGLNRRMLAKREIDGVVHVFRQQSLDRSAGSGRVGSMPMIWRKLAMLVCRLACAVKWYCGGFRASRRYWNSAWRTLFKVRLPLKTFCVTFKATVVGGVLPWVRTPPCVVSR